MKAIVQEEYGSADVLRFEDVETPVAGRGEVLIRVIAASAFIGDARSRERGHMLEGASKDTLQSISTPDFAILRLYSPEAEFFDKSWRPSEIEPV